jgi:AAA domain/Bifunctional DNA primase/polymerase, N-terminal/Primase C terminal 1 (PriCT-1)
VGTKVTVAAANLDALYPDRWAALLIAVGTDKRPLAQGWNTRAIERWSNSGASENLMRAAQWVASGGNLGLVAPPGCIVLDADTPDAVALLAQWLPDATPMQETARGAHFLLRVSDLDPAEIDQRVGLEIAPGVRVDLRIGSKGQIVVEPSVHESGATYCWKRPLPRTVEELPELPSRLRAKLPLRAKAGHPDNGSPPAGGTIPEGQRDATLTSLAGTMRRRGLSADAIEAALMIENATRCVPPLSGAEVAKIAHSVGRYAPEPQREPRPESEGEGSQHDDRIVSNPVLTILDTVVSKKIEWLWPQYIPRGKVSLLDGDPGTGKSNLTVDLAARITAGRAMPDGSPGHAGGVVLLSAEDDPADTIKPRLDAAGADTTRVVLLSAIRGEDGNRSPELPLDLPYLETAIASVNAVLVIVDPLMAFLGSRVDSYRDQDVRRALMPLKELAERTGAAVLVVRHLNKKAGGSPIYRGGGSIGIIGAARAGLLVGKDPSDPGRRVLAVSKNNLAPEASSLGFQLVEAENGASAVEWLGGVDHTAEAILAESIGEEARSALAEAVEFLRDELAEGPVESKQIQRDAQANGITLRTLDRAKARLSVEAKKRSFKSGWDWTLRRAPSPPSAEVGALRETWRPSGNFHPNSAAKSAKNTEERQVRQPEDLALFACDEAPEPDLAATPWGALPGEEPL